MPACRLLPSQQRGCSVQFGFLMVALLGILGKAQSLADWGYPEHKAVVILGKHNLDAFLKDFEMALVAFSTEWCDHCQALNSKLTQLAIYFKDHDARIPVAKVDCTKDLEFCNDHMVPVFPFVNFYVRGHPIAFLARQTTDFGLKSFVRKILGNSPIQVSFLDDLKAKSKQYFNSPRKQKKALALYYLPQPLKPTSNEDHHSTSSLDTMEALKPFHLYDLNCKLNDWLKCLWTNDLKLFETTGGSPDQPLVLLSHKGKPKRFPHHPKSLEDITDFLFHYHYPGLREADPKFERQIIRNGKDFLVLFVSETSDPAVESLRQACRHLKLRHDCVVASVDSDHPEIVSKLTKALDVDMKALPAVVYAQGVHNYTFRRFKLRGVLTNNSIEAFLSEVWSGERRPDLRSESVPLKNDGIIIVT